MDRFEVKKKIESLEAQLGALKHELGNQKLRTLLTVVLDESGSMSDKRDEVIKSFNDYLATQKIAAGDDAYISLYKFNAKVSTVYAQRPITEAPALGLSDYLPEGWTALLDAVNSGISAAQSGVWDRHLFVVITDGKENASRFTSSFAVQNMIKERNQRGNWTFVYLGADQDAWDLAKNYGFDYGNVLSFDKKHYGATMQGLAGQTVTYRAAKAMNSANFTDSMKT